MLWLARFRGLVEKDIEAGAGLVSIEEHQPPHSREVMGPNPMRNPATLTTKATKAQASWTKRVGRPRDAPHQGWTGRSLYPFH